MLKYYKIESGRLAVAPNEDAADIVIMGSLSQEQRSVLVKEYEITEHTIASAFDSDELSRIEYDDDFTTIVFKKPKNYSAEDNFQFRVESFGIFIFKDWVLLLTDSDIPVMDERKFSKIDSLNTFVLRVLSFAIAHFNEHLKIINRINDDLELRLNTSMDSPIASGFAGIPNHNETAACSGDRAFDTDQIAFCIDESNCQVLHCNTIIAHMTRSVGTLENTTGCGTGTMGTGSAKTIGLTVGLRAAAEVVALYSAGETAALAGTNHIDQFA